MIPEETLLLVLSKLDQCGIPYMITGSFASNVHGVPRATQDADVIIEADQGAAEYLAAVFGAPVVDKAIKPMQSRGQWGPRDIHKKVLDLPIPQFDLSESDHLRLADLGMACSGKVTKWLAAGDRERPRV